MQTRSPFKQRNWSKIRTLRLIMQRWSPVSGNGSTKNKMPETSGFKAAAATLETSESPFKLIQELSGDTSLAVPPNPSKQPSGKKSIRIQLSPILSSLSAQGVSDKMIQIKSPTTIGSTLANSFRIKKSEPSISFRKQSVPQQSQEDNLATRRQSNPYKSERSSKHIDRLYSLLKRC